MNIVDAEYRVTDDEEDEQDDETENRPRINEWSCIIDNRML